MISIHQTYVRLTMTPYGPSSILRLRDSLPLREQAVEFDKTPSLALGNILSVPARGVNVLSEEIWNQAPGRYSS